MCESTWTGAGDEVFEVMLISREKCSRWAFVTRKHDRSVLPLWFMFRQQITEPQTSWRCARRALGDGEWHNLNRYATYLCCWYKEMWRISAAESCRLFIEDKITSSAKSNVLFSHSELSGLLLLNKKNSSNHRGLWVVQVRAGKVRARFRPAFTETSREAFCREFQSETTNLHQSSTLSSVLVRVQHQTFSRSWYNKKQLTV